MRYFIIPDVHGRTFWMEPSIEALKDENTKLIFLGDYLDPYPDEFIDNDFRERAIQIFKEIIDLKKDYPDRVILLLGNHDLGYVIGRDVCNCRRDGWNAGKIRSMFNDNKEMFQLAYETKVNGKRVIFSHAGVILESLEESGYEGVNEDNVVDFINNQYELMMKNEYPDEHTFSHYLAKCSYWRGGYDKRSSCVWGDVREFIYDKPKNYGYQIFGHTRMSQPLRTELFAMLDCRKAFWLNEDGTIIDTVEGNEIPLTDMSEFEE